jgi:uncharacterized Zn finger protein
MSDFTGPHEVLECPHCGADDDMGEFDYTLDQDSSTQVRCKACGKAFSISVQVEVQYFTCKEDEEEDVEQSSRPLD